MQTIARPQICTFRSSHVKPYFPAVHQTVICDRLWHGENRTPVQARRARRCAPRPGPANLKNLAAQLQLSIATVSRVLSDAPAAKAIPQVTKDRVLAAAAAAQYRPNMLARSLRKQQSLTIGIMLPEISEGYATAVLSGIEDRLMEADYFFFVVSHYHRPVLIERCQEMLLDRAVEGLIAIDTPLTRRLSVPTVTVSGHHEPEGVTNIVLDHNKAATLAVDHLYKLGHRDIAFIKGQEFSSDTEARWEGIRAAVTARHLKMPASLTTQLGGHAASHDPGYEATRKLLAQGKRFTALFAFNDVSAIGAIRALREASLRVPEDVSVVGFDDVQSAAYQNPALTTVRQPLKKMGEIAAAHVLEQIGSAHLPAVQQIVVSPELVVRESTARR